MSKNKSHKGLLKRIRVTKTGLIKYSRAYGRHLRSRKSRTLLRSYRKPIYAPAPEQRRLASMIYRTI